MSAIAGIWRFDGASVRGADVERQICTMAHLGPDRSRVWLGDSIGLGHALMRVTEEDSFDEQPLIDPKTGIAAVADVRLDNREELGRALHLDAETLAKFADSALIAAAYKEWGEDCAAHLLGDFAFAIWDAPAQKLVLGRDHMGKRSVYFHRGETFFAFATQAKGLWALPDVPRRLDEVQLGRSLTFDFRGEPGRTRFEGIEALPGGTVLTVLADGTMRRKRYWTPAPDPAHLGRDEAYYIETYRKILTEAVECRIRRAVHPVGLFFSGGFDSALIAGLAAPVMHARRRKLVAASSVMPADKPGHRMDTRPLAEACARHMPHLDVRYVTREDARYLDDLEATFLRTDHASSANRVANHAIHKVISQAGARVIMDGHGGDGTLNPTAHGWLADRLRQGHVRTFLRELRASARRRRVSLWRVIRGEVIAALLPEWLTRMRNVVAGRGSAHVPILPLTREFEERVEAEGGDRQALQLLFGGEGDDVHGLTLLNQQQGLPACPGSGASAYGLEYTQPFHDKRVIEFALAIPKSLWVRDGRDRYLARKALGDMLPPELLARPRKVNDDRTPDLEVSVDRERADLLREIGRMETNPRLNAIFDFPTMRRMLRPADGPGEWRPEQRMGRAISGFMHARFIEWFERDNRGASDQPESEVDSEQIARSPRRARTV